MSFNSDQAKDKKKQDALGFADSAEATAKSIVTGKYPDGFVIGIEGEWGSGKTTYINFIRESLKKQSSKFKIIEFKPWLHSSQENLIAAYFKFLRENAKDIFGDDSDIKKSLASVAESFTPLVGALASLVALGDVAKSGMGLISETLKESPTLESQYEIIQKKLKESQKPFVVIIDDLDRLDSDEVKTMLKLVKSVGRLPYVTYILAYDRKYVENATNKEMPHFLEKIIQLSIPIPKPVQSKLLQMLDKELEVFLKNINNKNRNRFHELVNSALRPYIKKPRDIALLVNAINFYIPNKDINKALDPVDLFALECLRIFDKKLWDWIRDNREIILGEGDYTMIKPSDDEFKKNLETSLLELHPLFKNQKDTLSLLFPRLDSLFSDHFYRAPENNYNMSARGGIAVNAVYDAYFSQHLDESEVLQSDIDRFLENSHDNEKTMQTLKNWIRKTNAYNISKIGEFLNLLNFGLQNKPNEKPDKTFLWVLTDNCDDINSLETKAASSMPLHWQLLLTFRIIFERIGKYETNIFLQELCKDKARTSAATFLLHYIGYNMGKIYRDDDSDKRFFLIEDADWQPLIEIIAPNLADAFLTGAVGNFGNVIHAEFLAAHIFGDEQASAMFKASYGLSEQYVIKSVKSHLTYVSSSDGNSGYVFKKTEYPKLFDYNVLAEHVKKINPEKQDEETKQIINIFLDGVKNPDKNNHIF